VSAGVDPDVAGVAYTAVPSIDDYNMNETAATPSNPFGPVSRGDQQLSLYMDYLLDLPTPPF
jgi:hypothetical protein